MEAEEPDRSVRSLSPESTEEIGERLGRSLVAGSLVGLIGDLGSGKTTFVRGLARGLEVEEPVHSPTFTRMRELPGRLTLYHFDAWRPGSEALFEEGLEFLAGAGVSVVEWADRVERWLPHPRIEMRLRQARPAERELSFRVLPAGPAQGRTARELEAALRKAVEALESGWQESGEL